MTRYKTLKYTNSLVVALFTTQKEYKSGLIHSMLNQYLSKNPSSQFSFDWHIVFDQGEEEDYKDLLNFSNHQNIKNIFIHSLRIKDKDNFYSREYRSPYWIMLEYKRLGKPWLGNTCGANNLFFNGMDYMQMQNYKNILLLESDTQPLKNLWFDSLLEKCEHETFLILGSIYKGNQVINDPSGIIKNHLNGVAIYKNCVELSLILKDAKIFILNNTRLCDKALKVEDCKPESLNFYMNYDISIYHQSQSQKYEKHKSLFKNCEFITNTSLPEDTGISIKEIKAKYPQTIILHKKPSFKDQQTLLPVYYHIAKNAGTYVLSATSFLLDQHLKSKSPQEECGKIQASINFPSGNKCTVFLGGPGLHDYLALHYHAKIASTPYHKLDIGGTYPNNSNWTNLEYAQKLRENAVTALHKKFPQAKTYQDYQVLYEETIPLKIKKTSEFSPEEFLSFIQNNKTFIFAVLIEPRNSGSSFVKSELIGWEDNLEFINEICERHNRQPINFLTLREPFSRANSLFHYLTSSDSDHELVRDEIASSTFEQYIESEELEDSWLIRQVLCLKWSDPIDEGHYNIAIEKLKEFYIKDITQVDYLIEEIFSKSYNLSFSKAPESYLNRNKSSKINTLQFNQLPPRLQQKFLDRTRWDKKLYNRLTQ